MRLKDQEKNKLYTMIPSPSPENPYLNMVSHKTIIDTFKRGKYTYHTLSMQGELDFYYYFEGDLEDLEEVLILPEEIGIRVTKSYIELSLIIDNDELDPVVAEYIFNFKNPVHMYNFRKLVEEKSMDIFFVLKFDENVYACGGGKTILLPEALIYDLQRIIDGTDLLAKPIVSTEIKWARDIEYEQLACEGISYSFDFTALKDRFDLINNTGEQEFDTEEILSRHLLDGLAKIQNSRISTNVKGEFLVWVNRSHGLNKSNKPCEVFTIIVSGIRKAGLNILNKSMLELSEFIDIDSKIPLEEGAMPILWYKEQSINTIKIDIAFYGKAARIIDYFKSTKIIKKFPKVYGEVYQREMAKLKPVSIEERRKTKNKQ